MEYLLIVLCLVVVLGEIHLWRSWGKTEELERARQDWEHLAKGRGKELDDLRTIYTKLQKAFAELDGKYCHQDAIIKTLRGCNDRQRATIARYQDMYNKLATAAADTTTKKKARKK